MTTIDQKELHRVMGGVVNAGDAEHDNSTRPADVFYDRLRDNQLNLNNGLKSIPQRQPTGRGQIA